MMLHHPLKQTACTYQAYSYGLTDTAGGLFKQRGASINAAATLVAAASSTQEGMHAVILANNQKGLAQRSGCE